MTYQQLIDLLKNVSDEDIKTAIGIAKEDVESILDMIIKTLKKYEIEVNEDEDTKKTSNWVCQEEIPKGKRKGINGYGPIYNNNFKK